MDPDNSVVVTRASSDVRQVGTRGNGNRPWVNLTVAWLGWLFDGMEMGIYSLIAMPALKEMLHTQRNADVGPYLGMMFALFLIGAALGGVVFGWLGDVFGRVKALAATVICYSLFTGLSAACHEPWQFGACRFLGALGLGGEWGLGVALVMESWSNKSRPALAGILGTAANVGFLACSIVALLVNGLSWRSLLLIGILPATTVLFMLAGVREPEAWRKAKARGEKPDPRSLFEPGLRGKTIMGCMISSVVIVGTWGVFQWIPSWVNSMQNGNAAMVQLFMAIGQIIGAGLGGFVAEWLGRRWSYALFCLGSFLTSFLLYTTVHEYGPRLMLMSSAAGLFSCAFFGFLPLYLPELFPTRIRATGEGITYNFGRIVAAVGVFAGTGNLVKHFDGSFAKAGALMAFVYIVGMVLIWFMPETKGQGLPD
jgi:MFS transporter, SHS family, sialic acid transporter